MRKIPPREDIAPETPLRLSVAAAIAFPDGSMTAAGLRREAKRGRLIVERVAGKDYTTLASIEKMRELCRLAQKAPASGFDPRDGTTPAVLLTLPRGSSGTETIKKARDTALMIVQELSERSPPISPASIWPRRR
jgi:hypothetical protein